MGTLTDYPCSFRTGRRDSGTFVLTYSVTQVFRRYTDGKKGWKRSLLFVQFTGVSFVLGLLLVTLLQYGHLMNRDMGIDVTGLTEAESWLPKERVDAYKG